MDQQIKSRAYRILNSLGNYTPVVLADEIDREAWQVLSKIPSNEVLGVYINSDNDPRQNVIVTISGLLLFQREWKLYRFDEMTDVSASVDAIQGKSNVNLIQVTLTDGTQVPIRVTGGNEGFSDVWEVLRFLNRVLSLYKKIN